MANLLDLRGVGPARLEELNQAGIFDVRGLLMNLPRAYRDTSSPRALASLRPGEEAAVRVRVCGEPRITRGHGLTMVRCEVADDSDSMLCVWYNQPWLKQQLRDARELLLYGRVDSFKGMPRLICPSIVHETGIIPVYRPIGGIKSAAYRTIVADALEQSGVFPDPLPPGIRWEFDLCGMDFAIRASHAPESMEDLARARRRLAFEELLLYQVGIMLWRRRGGEGISIPSTDGEIAELWSRFAFAPTGAQKNVLREIASDLADARPMARLVQGDVGSGKTAVAFASIALAAKAGWQSALMAPTEVLAMQHYAGAREYLEPMGFRVGLLTGSMTLKQHREARDYLANGHWDCVVGTHALITANVEYKALGLVVTDEQHRFGVRQRTMLGNKGNQPNVLVMSATPIPRSLALILYGDLDLSVIDQLPPGKKPAITRIVPEAKRRGMYGFIRKELDAGRQAYVVCPLVEQSETVDARSAEDVYRDMKADFSGYSVSLVHGKMRAAEKEKVLSAFRSGEVQILVSTTVIEVGVNVPGATIMVIENAGRFGLAQLHQLRGRVGRGTGDNVPDSWCFLMGDADERLRLMVSTNDGFVIAQKDMEDRGAGELFGTRQTGAAAPGLVEQAGDMALLKETNEAAKSILSRADPEAETVRQAAREKLDEMAKGVGLN